MFSPTVPVSVIGYQQHGEWGEGDTRRLDAALQQAHRLLNTQLQRNIAINQCSHHAEEGGVPVEPEDLYQGEGHVERDEEEVGDAED